MIGKTILVLSLGIFPLWAGAASANACVIRQHSFIHPCGCGCFGPGFLGVGTHLGIGPGYPGLQPPFAGFGSFGICRGPSAPSRRIRRVIAFTIDPVIRIYGRQPATVSGPIAKDEVSDRPSPARAVVGPDFRRPAPALDDESKSGFRFGAYTPRRYYGGRYYAIDPAEVFDPDSPPGIIVWAP